MTTQVLHNLGLNIAALRKKREWTQAQLAKASGIPRTTLSYIESGSGNPSLKGITQIASALGVTCEELLASPRPACHKVPFEELKRIWRSSGQAERILLLPETLPGVQWERMHLKPQSLMVGSPHQQGTKEYCTCIQGKLELLIEGETHTLNPGDVLAFPGDCRHTYRNASSEMETHIISLVVLHYPL